MNLASLCVTCPHRLSGFCGALLEPEDLRSNQPTQWQRFFTAGAGEEIATRGEVSGDVFVLCAGWAFLYVQLPDGRRQILRFLLPGDVVSSTAIFEESGLFSVKALTEVMVSSFMRSTICERCAVRAGVRFAIAHCCVYESRDVAELATVLGQCSAEARIAHLLLRLMSRIAARSVIREHSYPLPLRQQHIADAVGLTPVHVSRVLGLFRDRGILTMSDGILKVLDMPELERLRSLK